MTRPGRVLGRIKSLKARVFIAIVLVAAVPIAAALVWALLLERTYGEPSPSATSDSVYRAWAENEPYGEVRVMEKLAGMKAKLAPADFAELSRRVEVIMRQTDEYKVASLDLRHLAEDGDNIFDRETLEKLATVGYYWGAAIYWWEESEGEPSGDSAFEVQTVGIDVPVVAWQTSPRRVDYIIVVPPESYSSSLGIPLWWYASVVGVALSVVTVLAVLATLLVTRGVSRPLRRMAEASEAVASGGELTAPAPVTGPPEVKRLAVSFNRMASESSRARGSEQSFLLSVSHELKTPLTAIRGYAEALEDGALPSKEAAETVGVEAERLQRLVQDLLDLARYQRSEFAVRNEKVDLSEVAHEVARRYEAAAQEFGLTLTVQHAEPALATGDRDRLIQVASNLVENALRCTPSGGEVTVEAAESELSVRDTGVGLVADDLPHAFERFYLHQRLSSDRKVGTGLGLAIVKELVERMGGGVGVESTPGEGTTFTVRLPEPERE